MNIIKQITNVILPFVLLFPVMANAQVVRPALDISTLFGGSGASLIDNPDPAESGFHFDINATAFRIVTDTVGVSYDVLPLQTFTLHGETTTAGGAFSGTFNVSGGLLSGTFNDLVITPLGDSLSFEANLLYDDGSLKGNLTGGRLEGIHDDYFLGASGELTAKLGPVVVPVPAAIWLFGTGLIGLAGIARRKA